MHVNKILLDAFKNARKEFLGLNCVLLLIKKTAKSDFIYLFK